MPSEAEELERKKATDTGDKSDESSSEQENKAAPQEEDAPVQTGDLSESDKSKLMEDPAAASGSSGGGSVAELRRRFEERDKNKDAGHEPTPEAQQRKEEVEEIRRRGLARAGIQRHESRSGGKGSESESSGSTPSQPASTPPQPASTPPADKYALLKKDLNTLSDTEKEERKRLLIEKYVVDWKKNKEEQMKELTEGLKDEEKSKEETRGSFATPPQQPQSSETGENVMEGISTGADVLDYGMSVASDFSGDNKGLSIASNVTGILTGGWGMFKGGHGMYKSHKEAKEKKKKGDVMGSRLARFDTFSGLFDFTGGAAGVAGSAHGLAGKEKASDRLGLASSVAGLASSSTELLKGAYHMGGYRHLASKAGKTKEKMTSSYESARDKDKAMKEEYAKGGEGARSKEKRMEMLRQRHARKRSKDFMEAMAAAQEHNKIRAKGGIGTLLKGAGSTLGSGISATGAFLKYFAGENQGLKLAGSILGAVGGAIGLATTGLSWLGKAGIFKKFQGKTSQSVNEQKGKEYIENKADKLMKKPEAQADHMTKEEALTIVAKRLGVNDPSNYAEVYKKLAERRADRILNKEEGYQEVLASLGLSENADKATILEALGVS